MPTIKYPNNPNVETAFVEQDDGTKNRVVLTAPQDISTIEYPNNPNSTKAYITVNGKKQRVVMTADIAGGGGSSLPDQTGHSGEFLTTDGTDASWATVNALQNTTTNTGSLGIDATTITSNYSITIGFDTKNKSNKSVVLGTSCETTAAAEFGIALGHYCKSSASHAIQLGTIGSGSVQANNNVANTMKVANANGNFELMSADGTIPTDRLTKVNYTITLTAAGWSSNTQTVSVTGMTATGIVLVSPDPTDQADYTSAGIICSAQAAGTLTFTCSTTPANDIDVVVVML